MNDSADNFDEMLEARFRREHTHIQPQPFVRLTLERVAAARARAALRRRVVQVLALVAVIVASPWLIAGSVRVSAALNASFELVSAWLATSVGLSTAVLTAAVTAAMYCWRVWRRDRTR